MTTAARLREIAQDMRPVLERMLDTTAELNRVFLDAWGRDGLDAEWASFRVEYPSLYLHYFIRARGTGDIKIGKTNHIGGRFKSLMTGASRGIDILALYPAPREHEQELHADFAEYRLNGEWFIGHSKILSYLRMIGSDVDALSNETSWYCRRKS